MPGEKHADTGGVNAAVNPVEGLVLADRYKASGSGLTGITTRCYKQLAAFGEAQCVELSGTMAAAGGYLRPASGKPHPEQPSRRLRHRDGDCTGGRGNDPRYSRMGG